MKRWILALLASGCGADPKGEVDVRDATAAECPDGGVTLVRHEQAYTLCSGDSQASQGETNSELSSAAPAGPAGQAQEGTGAAEPDVLTTTILCQSNDGTSYLSAYLWVMADGDVLGMCRIDEDTYSQTVPIIGRGCVLRSLVQTSLVYLNFADDPPTVGGALTGSMSCL